jgi:uncharacterized membrane protein required for colicin V production
MSLDVLLGSVALLMVYLGWRSGISKQLLRVAAAVSVVLFTAPASRIVAEVIAGGEITGRGAGFDVGVTALTAFLLYFGITAVGSLVIRAVRETSDTLSALDKGGGALVGALKAALVVYVCGVVVYLAQGALEKADPEDRMHLRDGAVTAFVGEHDVIGPWRFPALGQLHAALRSGAHAKDSKRAARELRDWARVADLLRREDVAALLDDEALVEAARRDHYPVTLVDPRVRKLLADDAFVEELARPDWETLEEAIGSRPKPAADAAEGAEKDGAEGEGGAS